ncbi:WD40-repeat-containing domain protein [Aspergillus californicus]
MLWEPNTGKLQRTLDSHHSSVCCLVFCRSGQLLASGSTDWTIKLWNPNTGDLLRDLCHSAFIALNDISIEDNPSLPTSMVHNLSLSISSNGLLLASCVSMIVNIWSISTGELLRDLDIVDDLFRYRSTITFSPTDLILVSCTMETVNIWDPTVLIQHQETNLNESHQVKSMAFSPDGHILASGYTDGTLHVWDHVENKLLWTKLGHSDGINFIRFSPDGNLLASCAEDQSINLWDSVTGDEQCTILGHTSAVIRIDFLPDGKMLASGSVDGSIKVWDLKNRHYATKLGRPR